MPSVCYAQLKKYDIIVYMIYNERRTHTMLKLSKEPFGEKGNRFNYILKDTRTGLSLQVKPSFVRDYKTLEALTILNEEENKNQ